MHKLGNVSRNKILEKFFCVGPETFQTTLTKVAQNNHTAWEYNGDEIKMECHCHGIYVLIHETNHF